MKFKKIVKIISLIGVLSLSGLAEAKPQEPKHDLVNKPIGNVGGVGNFLFGDFKGDEALYQAFDLYSFRNFGKKLTKLSRNRITDVKICQSKLMSPFYTSIQLDSTRLFQSTIGTLYGKKLNSDCAKGGYYGRTIIGKQYFNVTFYQAISKIFKDKPDLARLVKENSGISVEVMPIIQGDMSSNGIVFSYLFPKDSKDYYNYSDISSLTRAGSSL